MELAILLKVMLRKGDVVEERETTELPLFPLRGLLGKIHKDTKVLE